jgi:hypothetical protein
MKRIHFRAKLTGGTIVVPPEIVERVGDEEVEISIDRVVSDQSTPLEDGLTYLLHHPLGIKDFKMPTKDEIHSRDW